MYKNVYLWFIITYLIHPSHTLCIIQDNGLCFFTITCQNPSVIAAEPFCNHGDMYITLTIHNSTVEEITPNFFASKLDPWIRIFNAIGYNWTVVHPFAFSNFKNVLYMDISDNKINDIGPAFKDLKELDSLNLSRNRIEDIGPNTFYISNNVNRLYLLDLSYNRLTYLPDKAFQHLNNLRKLYLQGNQITVIENVWPKYLRSLDYLNLCCNNMSSLNTPLKYMKKLKEINLSTNKIEHLNISELISLETIDLSHNKIKHFRFDYFDKIPHFMKLDLSYNKITKLKREKAKRKVSNDINTPLRSVKLDFKHNHISYIDKNFFLTFNYIRYLILRSNKITILHPGTFKHVRVLRFLDISSNTLKLDDQTFRGLKKTEIIDISKNNIFVLKAAFFKGCVRLTKIVAIRNPIKSVNLREFKNTVPKLAKILLTPVSDSSYLQFINELLYIILEFLIDVVLTFVLFLLLFGILFLFIYIGLYRRIICYYILKCARSVMARNRRLK
ncbi:unnamed protein product [Chrysodeixis includens]|uniref:Uncharacterized protein n=1 Tax=Chrysodeixis includens TaxID=689277 RepID=A0A9P0FRW5_CHRIL|nr:unnamed protein product [Chrysodeixis includens]